MEMLDKIAKSTKLELLNVTYALLLSHIENAINEEVNRFNHIELAKEVLTSLIENLNFKADLSKDLFRLYIYIQSLLVNGLRHSEKLEEAYKLISIIYDGYNEINLKGMDSYQSSSKIISGFTYGKGYLNNIVLEDEKRGFNA